jgi:hypothetical protein
MAQANDAQMQQFVNERVRVRAEQFRTLVNACRDDKAAMDDVYDRAVNGAAWNDNRTDGPPSLANSQDVLTFNAFIDLFLKCIDGTATAQNVIDLGANWESFQTMCVRPVSG